MSNNNSNLTNPQQYRNQIQSPRQGNINSNNILSPGTKIKGNTTEYNQFSDFEKKIDHKNLINKDIKINAINSKQIKDIPLDKSKKLDPFQNIDSSQKDNKQIQSDKKVLTEPSQQYKSNNQKFIGQSSQLTSKFLSPHKNTNTQQPIAPVGHQRKLSQKIEAFKYRTNNEPNTLKTQLTSYPPEISANISPFKQQKNLKNLNSPRVKQPRMSEPVKNSSETEQQYNKSLVRTYDYFQNPSLDSKSYKSIQSDPFKPSKSKISIGESTQQILNQNNFKKNKDFSSNLNSKYANNKPTNNNFNINEREEIKVADFIKGKLLGSGKFGSVNVVKHKKTGFVCAMKAIPKSMIRQQNIINQLIREIKIQSCLDHPNIIKLYGFFCDKDNFYLLLELASEGHLYGLLKEKRCFKQNSVVYIMKQLCEALKYLHNSKIIHRDLKPENIVFQYGIVKICDFGWSVNKGSNQLRSTFCGTPLYVSPQILKGHLYDQKIDIWSIGILAYELLVGDIPFQITTEDQLIKIIKEDINFPSNVNISNEAKDFVLKILKKNPNQRLKVDKLLDHPFLTRQIEQWSL